MSNSTVFKSLNFNGNLTLNGTTLQNETNLGIDNTQNTQSITTVLEILETNSEIIDARITQIEKESEIAQIEEELEITQSRTIDIITTDPIIKETTMSSVIPTNLSEKNKGETNNSTENNIDRSFFENKNLIIILGSIGGFILLLLVLLIIVLRSQKIKKNKIKKNDDLDEIFNISSQNNIRNNVFGEAENNYNDQNHCNIKTPINLEPIYEYNYPSQHIKNYPRNNYIYYN